MSVSPDKKPAIVTLAQGESAPKPELKEGLLTQCAWQCKRFRTTSGGWVPQQALNTDIEAYEISHTICPDCFAEVEKDIPKIDEK